MPSAPTQAAPDTLPALDLETATRLRAVIGRLARHLRPTPAGREAGLTPTRASVLLHIVRAGQARVSDLAEEEGLNPTMLSRVLGELCAGELTERFADARDRRAAWVRPTPAGVRLAERMRRERTEAMDAALRGMDDAERSALADVLPALESLAERLREQRG